MIDLHIHTVCSDGTLTPFEVIDEAYKNNVKIISISDHDTIEAYSKELFDYAKEKNIKLIPAVEISTKKKIGFHVLGYNFDLNNNELIYQLSLIRNARHDYLMNVSKKLNELGYIINTLELDKIDAVTKAHIANDIINNELNKKILIDNFGHIPNKGEFIENIMNENCKAYVKKNTITPKEAAILIKKAGGKVVLAHPVAYKYEDNVSEDEIYDLVKEMDADGIESNYIYIDRNNKKINEVEYWNKFASIHHLKTTIGSDFHTFDGIHPIIGLIDENINLSKEEINNILNFLED